MRIYVDSADINEIREWAEHPWVSGFTTNPTLFRDQAWEIETGWPDAMEWAREAVSAAAGKPISIDGPPEVWELGPNVWRKVVVPPDHAGRRQVNLTAVCHEKNLGAYMLGHDIVSVFAGRIMDTGRDPVPVIESVKKYGAQVLWASVREPYNITQAERAGCDIVTVPPAILRKYLDWHGKPLEVVAEETIAQFDRDRDGLW